MTATPAKQKWSQSERLAFQELAPCALYVAGPELPVSGKLHDAETGAVVRAFGSGRGLRLVALGINSQPPWQDKISAAWNKSPFWRARLLIRLWVPSDQHAARLEAAATAYFRRIAAEADLNASFVGLAPDVPIDDPATGIGVKQHLEQLARGLKLQWIMDDAQLWEDCHRIALRALGLAREGKRGR